MRVVTRGGSDESDGVLDSKLRALLGEARKTVRADGFDASDFAVWKDLISTFLKFISRPALNALSPSYQQGSRLDDVIRNAVAAFRRKLAVDDDPVTAIDCLSEEDPVRILTVHKCKGLEFEKVIVVGVEKQFFGWSDVYAEFFVEISRAKDELVLTYSDFREKPDGENHHWREQPMPHSDLLGFAEESA